MAQLVGRRRVINACWRAKALLDALDHFYGEGKLAHLTLHLKTQGAIAAIQKLGKSTCHESRNGYVEFTQCHAHDGRHLVWTALGELGNPPLSFGCRRT